ncbi:hypothetical protein JR316_0006007 [Psilocybe cubensis]|uniref:Uncharacterized protein n=1 Tax=Psilocybe cubensis TaxID=181762 RepID=A0ACB8H0G3_PSICU|nr:hypothetical protein JR316_0006007 [Psilocybe cubensis]KAH9481480.1 hypothetical protein JR316_0006007 [Psilocybe cubensis]
MNKTKSPIDLNDKINKEDEIGTLIVVLLKARNLNDKHSFRKSDVFAQATLNGIQKRTHVDIKGGQRPEWDGEVRFTIVKHKAEKYRKLEVACYSQEPRSEDLMGQGFVDISETLRTGEFDGENLIDWVPLEVDGVQRGELYLEMTYYANKAAPTGPPVPNKQLAAVQAQNNLTRRPSKLSPADRLSRPQQTAAAVQYAQVHSVPGPTSGAPSSRPHQQHYPSQAINNQGFNPQANALPTSLVPTHPASTGSSPKGKQDALPSPFPEHRRAESLGITQQPQSAVPLPTILRPGANGSTTPPSASGGPRPIGQGHVRHHSQGQGESSAPNAYIPGTSATSQNPYIGGATTPPRNHGNTYVGGNTTSGSTNPYVAKNGSPPSSHANPYVGSNILPSSGLGPGRAQSVLGYGSPPPSGPPLLWQQSTSCQSDGSFSFPMPMIVPPSQEQIPHQSFSTFSEHNGDHTGGRAGQHYHHRPTHRVSSSREEQFDPYLQARYQSPLPLPPGVSASSSSIAPTRPAPPTPAPTTTAPAPAPSTRVPTPPPKTDVTPGPDKRRLEALRRAEEEAARRREQELKDLELAMQLDRELNLTEERASGANGDPPIPGRWQ